VRLLSEFAFTRLDCVFGSERLLGSLKMVIAFQKLVTEQTWAAIRGLEDERKAQMLAERQTGQLQLRVAQHEIVHATIYLLEASDRHRVAVGSANLSEPALGGQAAQDPDCHGR